MFGFLPYRLFVEKLGNKTGSTPPYGTVRYRPDYFLPQAAVLMSADIKDDQTWPNENKIKRRSIEAQLMCHVCAKVEQERQRRVRYGTILCL